MLDIVTLIPGSRLIPGTAQTTFLCGDRLSDFPEGAPFIVDGGGDYRRAIVVGCVVKPYANAQNADFAGSVHPHINNWPSAQTAFFNEWPNKFDSSTIITFLKFEAGEPYVAPADVFVEAHASTEHE